jgi:hypothetical protein
MNAETPPRPPVAYQVGALGHRDLSSADPEQLRTAATRFFRDVGTAVVKFHSDDQASALPLFSAEAPRLRCVCGLAAGADSILAEAALAEGWALVAILPFAVAEYERDFAAGPELDRFRTLLVHASVVCELDGRREASGLAYAEVGRLIVEQADVLLSVWDGLPARGLGGTGDVVRMALDQQKPVAVLPPSGSTTLYWSGLKADEVAKVVRSALTPPEVATDFLHAYYAEAPSRACWAFATLRGFERLALIGARFDSAPALGADPDKRSPVAEVDTELQRHFDAADQLALHYAARYRAAGLMRYALVVPASASALIASSGGKWMQAGGNLAQFIFLALIVAFSASAWREPAHLKFIAYRALAEHLRNARLLAAFGPASPRVLASGGPALSDDGTLWQARAVLRAIGCRSVRFDETYLAAAKAFVGGRVVDQITFLQSRAQRFETVARRLSRIGVALSICGILFTGARAVLIIGDAGQPFMNWFNEAALLLPAMAPIFLGLLSFNEYKSISTRYRAIAAQLQTLLGALDAIEPRRADRLAAAKRIVEVMLQEGAEWRQSIKARTVSAY